jgi:hypothetical protein
MIQASERWCYDRLGQYKTVELVTEYVSPEIAEIALKGKQHELFSILIGRAEVAELVASLTTLLAQMQE